MNPTLDYETPDPTRRHRRWALIGIFFLAGCAFGAITVFVGRTVSVSAPPATPVSPLPPVVAPPAPAPQPPADLPTSRLSG